MPSIKEMHRRDPHCAKCGCLTVLSRSTPYERTPDNTATKEHIYPRGHPLRAVHRKAILLYCSKCNTIANVFWMRTLMLYSQFPGVLTITEVHSLQRVLNPYGEDARRIRAENRERLKLFET